MTLLTKTKKCTNSSSDSTTFTTKPYGYLTQPDPLKPADYKVRAMVLLDHTYSSAPTITQSSLGAIHYVDIDLGTQGASSGDTFVTEDIDVVQASGEERVVVRLFENLGRGTTQVGEVTLFFADSDDEVLSDFGPSAYIVNTPDGGDNTDVSALIPLDDHAIESTSIVYKSDSKTFEITIDVVSGSASNPLEYSTGLDMDEDDSVEFIVKKGGSKKGKTKILKQYADEE